MSVYSVYLEAVVLAAVCAFPVATCYFIRTLTIILRGKKFSGRITSYYVAKNRFAFLPSFNFYEAVQIEDDYNRGKFLIKPYGSLRPYNSKRKIWVYKDHARSLLDISYQWVFMLISAIVLMLILNLFINFNPLPVDAIILCCFGAAYIPIFYYLYSQIIHPIKRLGVRKFIMRGLRVFKIYRHRDKLVRITFPFCERLSRARGKYVSVYEVRAISKESAILQLAVFGIPVILFIYLGRLL